MALLGLTGGHWRGRRVLVTGHTGFKGAWLALWLRELGAEVTGLALPPDQPEGIYAALHPWAGMDEHLVDIRDADAVAWAVAESQPEVVFHLAAQALVRRGYADPTGTYATNVVGTANVLEAVGIAESVRLAVVVTSDKVYRHDGTHRRFVEDDPLGGMDPYSTSKACAELVVAAWRQTGRGHDRVAVATARAGNVFGGGDWADDRLIPDALRARRADEPLRLRYPNATRPWQFVLDPLAGYLLLAAALGGEPAPPAAVNFGPRTEDTTVAELVDALAGAGLAPPWKLDEGVHPPESPLLSLDSSLAERTLGWTPHTTLHEGLEETVAWYRAQADGADLLAVSREQLQRYRERWA